MKDAGIGDHPKRGISCLGGSHGLMTLNEGEGTDDQVGWNGKCGAARPKMGRHQGRLQAFERHFTHHEKGKGQQANKDHE